MTVVPSVRKRFSLPLLWTQKSTSAVFFGLVGIICFSFTLPATHIAAPVFGSITVGLGRIVIAAVLAAMVLLIRRERIPARHTWRGLIFVSLGVVIGFPLFSTLALQGATIAHSAIINGLLPLGTAVAAVIFANERPAIFFWIAGIAGAGAVVLFVLVQGGGTFQPGDWWMLAAVTTGAVGYAEGGRIAKEIGGWRVICWALLMTAPFVIVPVGISIYYHPLTLNIPALAGLGYVSVVSIFLGFFAWYHGLALGGIARVGQLQLLQPLLTIGWAVIIFSEPITFLTGFTALLVIGCVVIGQRTRGQASKSSEV